LEELVTSVQSLSTVHLLATTSNFAPSPCL
jgi:hypothetical protein